MKLHNVRLGLATNSSSTHSLIFLDTSRASTDAELGAFGWEHWTASSTDAKRSYLGAILRDQLLSSGLGQEVALSVASAWSGFTVRPDDYVDHQSVWDLPRTWSGVGLDESFVTDLRRFLERDDVAVLGGNDNDSCDHPLDGGKAFQLSLSRDSREPWVARYDKAYRYWSLFNRETGAKIRMSFETPDKDLSPDKSTYPELVDVKITDFCPYGCAFCYQGSTETGKHASLAALERTADILAEWRVFEVALGGGEPTLHPNFKNILRVFRSRGVVPNFTTRNLTWLRDAKGRAAVLEQAGAFAFSVDNAKQVRQLAAALEKHDVNSCRTAVQYIVGQDDGKELYRIARAAFKAGIRLVLLGYKTSGRGSLLKPYSPKWIDVVARAAKIEGQRYVSVGIDTALAGEHKNALRNRQVSPLLYTTTEGKFSMYVDAVAGAAAPSSYCDPSLNVQVDLKNISGLELKEAYAEF
jgi:pyruvate-formate lyase-activating enzyme